MSELDKRTLMRLDMGVIIHEDCIYHDKVIPDACDLFGTANCNKCTNYVKK
jgi:hypothetical protein